MSVLTPIKRKDVDIWDFHFSYNPIIINININDYLEVINIVNSLKICTLSNDWIKRKCSMFNAIDSVKHFIYKYHSNYKRKQKMFIDHSTNLLPELINIIISY